MGSREHTAQRQQPSTPTAHRIGHAYKLQALEGVITTQPTDTPPTPSRMVEEEAEEYGALEQTIARFRSKPSVPNLQGAAQKRYSTFCRNRTADLYTTFLALVGEAPDFTEAKFAPAFNACVPFPGRNNERAVCGMARFGVAHGVVRYEYKGNIIEECRKEGREHGLRVVWVQTGDIWLRLFSEGQRLAQVVLSSDYSVAASPKPIDEGGLKALMSHLHLILECFEAGAAK